TDLDPDAPAELEHPHASERATTDRGDAGRGAGARPRCLLDRRASTKPVRALDVYAHVAGQQRDTASHRPTHRRQNAQTTGTRDAQPPFQGALGAAASGRTRPPVIGRRPTASAGPRPPAAARARPPTSPLL